MLQHVNAITSGTECAPACCRAVAGVVGSTLLGGPRDASGWLRCLAQAVLATLPVETRAIVRCGVIGPGAAGTEETAARDSQPPGLVGGSCTGTGTGRTSRISASVPGCAGMELVIRIDAAEGAVLSEQVTTPLQASIRVLAQGYADQVARPARRRDDLLGRVSPSQRQILPMLIEGKTEREIASAIHRSPHTVHDHVKTIYATLGIASRFELLALWGEPALAGATAAA